MKLKNSIKELQKTLDKMIKPNVIPLLKRDYLLVERNDKIKDSSRLIRFNIWWAIPKEQRDLIIEESLPRENWIGGYPDHTDEQLYTLLKKCIPENLFK